MPSGTQRDRGLQILSLIHDPQFIEFEVEQEAPSIFNSVGRTYTETWHSALLGWLLDPQSSHGLREFPLMRLLMLLALQDTLPTDRRGVDLNSLIASADYSKARVRPNERQLEEVSVKDVGRFDVLVDEIAFQPWTEIQLLLETKVKARIDRGQCGRYIHYIERKKLEGVLILPIFIAPTRELIGTPVELFGDDRWFSVDYQAIYDEIIDPCLHHPALSSFGEFTLSEYVKTLKYRQPEEGPLAITQRERDLVNALMEKHEPAIRALYEILSQSSDDFSPLSATSGSQNPIKIQIGNDVFTVSSVKNLYQQILKYLYDNRYLDRLELPIESGSKRYLLATAPQHQRGNDFIHPAEYKGFYMEANKSRDGALRDLKTLLSLCGLSYEIKS